MAERQSIPTSKRFQDLTGKRFGRLMVLEWAGRLGKYKSSSWRCRCDCGNERTVRASDLKENRGGQISCGCYAREAARKRFTRHGKNRTPEHRSWAAMIQRCTDVNYPAFQRYGAKGIAVCERWLVFENFLADMGLKPSPQASVERIDNRKGYEPGNCKWGSRKEQTRNRSNTRMETLRGETKPLAVWAELYGVRYGTALERLRRGWTLEETLLGK